MTDEEKALLVTLTKLLEQALHENAAAFDMLGLLTMAFARSAPEDANALRAHLATLCSEHSEHFTPSFLTLCRRMDWSLSGRDMDLLSQTSASKSAVSATAALLRALKVLGTPSGDEAPPESP
jgi:hypothetical protein